MYVHYIAHLREVIELAREVLIQAIRSKAVRTKNDQEKTRMSTRSNGTKNAHQSPTPLMNAEERAAQQGLAQDCLNYDWAHDSRWSGIERPYTAEDVLRLRGSIHIEHTVARLGAERLWNLLQTEPYVNALGAVTGNQAVQQVQAGLKGNYVKGWE